MRIAIAASTLLLAATVCGGARADHAPGFVVPGHPGLPVFLNGYDASWGVVEGDWGLHRPGHMRLTVTYAPPVGNVSRERHYFPYTGRTPRRGRHEILTPHRLRPAESFYREWSTHSDPLPVTEYAPFDTPGGDSGAAQRNSPAQSGMSPNQSNMTSTQSKITSRRSPCVKSQFGCLHSPPPSRR